MVGKHIGILTAGGDAPGLNAAIRGLGKTGLSQFSMEFIGFKKGFRGLARNKFETLDAAAFSGILTRGGTILGTSRDKPNKMDVGGKLMDMTPAIVETYKQQHLDALVCLGGGGTQKNALLLKNAGLNVITLPKTIDNDVYGTDITFGFDTALGIATDAIDRLQSTAHSHHRIIVVELMGHNSGWLTLGSGIAGGASVVLIPEIPYTIDAVANSIRQRVRKGKRFSIVAVAEGALTTDQAIEVGALKEKLESVKLTDKESAKAIKQQLKTLEHGHINNTLHLSHALEQQTGLESRITILGHLQRGGTPSAADRILATQLGAMCAELLDQGHYGQMVAFKNGITQPVPLEEIAGKKKRVPADHPWVRTARNIGICLGD